MSAEPWIPQLTEDGSFTFFSKEFGEAFHSRYGARQEAFFKFARVTDLVERSRQGYICLLDVCYGLGYNTAAALETIWATNPYCQVEVYGLELDETVPRAAISPPLIESWSPEVQSILQAIALEHHCTTPQLTATLLIGDARQTVQMLATRHFQADAIFFDPFSPRRCPQLWTVEFFAQIARCLKADGKLATYSRSASVRSALLEAGLQIGTIPLENTHLPHEWSQGTVAAFHGRSLPSLSLMEQEHLQTRAAIPYRDPLLSDSAETIRQRHHQEQQYSQRESTSSWRRRWGIR
ncbi:tRNA (5-methylaminomethyl-2-thiouridine)(34)-methyltransferase MnmD [Leptothermofonsia sp. ETS-13]|uniref:tRNA (5-methylaminomethyl-2-thiouridine)(34)-methyltransferase MnmD n=1 Tax=Leptothermofonsia sp. ETS-13 TaxID=3035696 RepID=UPI003BA16E5C